MSYQMTHLEVAYRLLAAYEWVNDQPDFLLGAIAPDSVHFREGYQLKWKEQSHLWDCGPRWGITLDSDRWKQNALDFWHEHKTDPNRDFIAGYCVHVLTDWFNDRTIWLSFIRENLQGEDVDAIYPLYGQEAYRSDQWLYHNSNNSGEIMRLLAKSQAHSIEARVLWQDVETQKQHILTVQYEDPNRYDISGHRYCTQAGTVSFIEACVEELKTLLTV